MVPESHIPFPHCTASIRSGRQRCLHQVYTTLFATAGKKIKEEPENYRGAFLDPVAQLSEPSEDALREDLADDLWQLTNQVLEGARVF